MTSVRILVVENYEPFQRIISSTLAARPGFQVFEAVDGLDAIQKATELQPDLIILDIGLPKLTGIGAAKCIREIAPHAKLLFLSQEYDPNIVGETFRLGAMGYIHKKHALTDVLSAVDVVLKGGRFVSRNLQFSESTTAPIPEVFDLANEAIRETNHAESKLRGSEELFRLAMNNVAAGVYTLNPQGLVMYVNPAAETMLGWTNTELLGKKMHDATHYKHADGTPFPASECPGLQVVEKGIELREQEDVFIRKDGSFFPVVYSASPLKKDGQTVGIVVGFRDDSGRRRAERAVRESEERFRLVANTAPVMIWMSGTDKLCTYVNRPWLDFTGRPVDAELGEGWTDGIHKDDRARCWGIYSSAFDRRQPFQMEFRHRRFDGEYRWMLDSGVPRFDEDKSFAGYIGSVVDVTELKLAEAALSTIGQRLIEAQEEERAWVARELHDDIGQRISVLNLEVTRLRACTSLTEVREDLSKVAKEVSKLGLDTRDLSHRLHSSSLDYLGLEAATSDYCGERSRQHNVSIDFQAENIPKDLPRNVSLCLFRVMQEGVQNAIKHSASRQIQVQLKGREEEIVLTVQDSGKGFKTEDALRGRGLGLTSMKERLKLLSGSVSIDSWPGRGTTIEARVPLLNAASNAQVTTSPLR